MEYYVYVLLDPRKQYQPFYIGMGKNDRAQRHLYSGIWHNRLTSNTIKAIKATGLEFEVIKYATNLTQEIAFGIEKQLIFAIGRKIDGTGPLTNVTDGGEGTQGIKRPDLSERNTKTRKPVYQIDNTGKINNTFESAKAAANALGLGHGNVAACCKTSRSAGGFYWRYVANYDPSEEFAAYSSHNKTKAYNTRKLLQIDATGNTINTFNSVSDAKTTITDLGGNYSALYYNASKGNIYKGYTWRLA